MTEVEIEKLAVFQQPANGHRDVVELLIAKKADVNARDNEGATPLHQAALKDYKDMTELLLASKADVNATNIIGLTPLHLAVSRGHEDLAELLRRHGGHE